VTKAKSKTDHTNQEDAMITITITITLPAEDADIYTGEAVAREVQKMIEINSDWTADVDSVRTLPRQD
jgi:hypothetical protein